ncbi:MAG: type II toxin-antitoxin system Phd/YefM family antitoxin [Deltaproteobacteria bacterium]|nr:type II toxin-antitoxin system Phd/YefM family antitoxin [Deltaproteobacteria bacterium]
MIRSLTEDIIPISDLVHGASKVIKRLQKTQRPIFVTQNGRATMVCMDVKDFEKRFEREVFIKALQEGSDAIERGDCVSLEEFKKELEKM